MNEQRMVGWGAKHGIREDGMQGDVDKMGERHGRGSGYARRREAWGHTRKKTVCQANLAVFEREV